MSDPNIFETQDTAIDLNPPRWIAPADIENITAHHPPANEAVAKAHQEVRHMMAELMHAFNDMLPDCPEKVTLIKHKCRETMMWANAIIATVGIAERPSVNQDAVE